MTMIKTLRKLGLIPVLMLLFSGALLAQKPKTALELNDQLVSITDSLYRKGQRWGEQFNRSYENKDFVKLAPYRKEVQNYIDQQLVAVGVLKDIGGSEDFRAAMIKFLTFEKDMVTNHFIPMEKLNTKSTDEEIKAEVEKLTGAAEKEGDALGAVNKAQEAYAAKNGFSIEPEKEK